MDSGGVRGCDSCQSARAAVYCRADVAYLCTGCDVGIHAMNPISRRHHRVPLTSSGYKYVDEEDNHNDYEALFGEVDDYLDLVEFKSYTEDQKLPTEVKGEVGECLFPKKDYDMEMEFGYSAPLELSYSVPLSSIEVSRIVPDDSYHQYSSKATTEHFSAPQLNITNQFSPMDREARVLRYREKKKSRKFEKTIRYASRKAYAEARPRIKGRFAKRTDVELEVDQMFSNYVVPEDSYGIVPSF